MADRSTLLGEVVADRYRLRESLGSGTGASAVFEADDLRSGGTVVLRLAPLSSVADPAAGSVDPDDAIDQWNSEMAELAALQHPSLAAISAYGVTLIDDVPIAYTAVQHFEGGSLREVLDRGRRLSPSQALLVGLDACRALHFLHGKGVVHGDVRPANLFLGSDQRVRLAGLAAGPVPGASRMGIERATYAAPEVALGEQPSPNSDVYSLAMTLLELITGDAPFRSENAAITLSSRVGKLLPVSADLGPIAPLLERAGRPVADERYGALEFGRALAETARRMPAPQPIETLVAESFQDVLARKEAAHRVEEAARTTGRIQRTTDLPIVPMTPATQPVPRTPATQPVPLVQATQPLSILPEPGDALPTAPQPIVVAPEPDVPEQRPVFAPVESGEGASGLVILRSDEPIIVAPPREVARHRRLLAVLGVAALCVAGFVAFRVFVKPSYVVPNVAGLTEGEARNQLAPFGWEILMRAERSDTAPSGTVIATDPAIGERYKQGSPLVIIVSEGPSLAVLPDVSGKSVEEALALLADLGLVPSQTTAESEDVPAGQAVAWVVPEQPGLKPGDEVLRGTAIQVLVSSGPAQREVPSIIGLTVEEATALLAELKLVLVETDPAKSNAAEEGKIGAQSPAPGEVVARDSSIAYSISLGPDLVKLPNIVGNSYSTVERRLEEDGFVVGKVTGNKNSRLRRAKIGDTEVDNGDMVARGATVDLEFP
jgi:serine/threonine-protein kinase